MVIQNSWIVCVLVCMCNCARACVWLQMPQISVLSGFLHVFQGFKTYTNQSVFSFSLGWYKSFHCVGLYADYFLTKAKLSLWMNWILHSHSEILHLSVLIYCFFEQHIILCMFISFIKDILLIFFTATSLKAKKGSVRGLQSPCRVPFLSAESWPAAAPKINKKIFSNVCYEVFKNMLNLITLVMASKQRW